MRAATVAFAVTICGLELVACQRSHHPGEERENCRDDHTCDHGLLCLSNLCVRPPPADCNDVAQTLTSLELGNYAPPEERAPVVARYKAKCEAAMVSKEEGACLVKARDLPTGTACVPSMFAAGAGSGSADCADVVRRVREAVAADAVGSDAQRLIDQMQASCTEDAWPEPLKRCIVAAKPRDRAALDKCNELMPKELQDKIQQRMMANAPKP